MAAFTEDIACLSLSVDEVGILAFPPAEVCPKLNRPSCEDDVGMDWIAGAKETTELQKSKTNKIARIIVDDGGN